MGRFFRFLAKIHPRVPFSWTTWTYAQGCAWTAMTEYSFRAPALLPRQWASVITFLHKKNPPSGANDSGKCGVKRSETSSNEFRI